MGYNPRVMIEAKVNKLASGLRVISVPMDGVGSVCVMALVGVGSRYEPKRLNGMSHFLEHMPFKGTAKWPTSMDLSSAVDSIGAEFNAFTSKEYTGFYVKSTAKQMEFDMDVVSDLLYAPRLKATDIAMEKGVIAEEIKMYNDMPKAKVSHVFDRLMYGDNGLGRRIDGLVKTIQAFERTDFVEWRKQWYGLDNVVVVVAGAITQNTNNQSPTTKQSRNSNDQNSKLIDLVGEYFEGKARGFGKRSGEKVLGYEAQEGIRCQVEYMKSDQAHLVLGFPALAQGHPDRYALAVLSNILGGSMSSRLFSEVREKRGLAYYVYTDIDRYADTGCLAVAAGVDTKRISEAMKAIFGVLAGVADGGRAKITEAEVRRAQEYFAGSMVLSLEGSRSQAQYWGLRAVLDDDVIGPDEMIRRVRAVTAADVERVAGDVLKAGMMNLAVVGPYKDGAKLEKLLKW